MALFLFTLAALLEGLFAAALVLRQDNSPTVDELLREASRQVRAIMWEVTVLDGPALAAAWPPFAGHVARALAAVPLPDEATRLLIHRAAGPRYRPNRWGPPVDAEPELHLLRAGQALAAAADLLNRYAVPPASAAARNDAALVRRRIAEILFIGAHATALGLGEHANQLQPARATGQLRDHVISPLRCAYAKPALLYLCRAT